MSEVIQEKFVEIIAEAVASGYTRGVDVFTEGLEEDLAKGEVLAENSVEAVIDHLMVEMIEESDE